MSSQGPMDSAAAAGEARRLLQNRQFDDAIRILQQAAGQDPRSAEVYELLGVAYSQKGMVAEGIQALSSAVNLNPQNATTRVNLSVALQRADRWQEAAANLEEALRIDPANEKARQALDAVRARLGQAAPPPASPYGQPPAQPGYMSPPPQQGAVRTDLAGNPIYDQPTQMPYGQQPPPGPQPPYGQPPPYGAQPPGPGMAPPPGYQPGPYAQPSPYGQPGYGAPGYGAYGVVPDDPNGWSPANIGPILTNPVEFFQRQRGQKGFGGPIGYWFILFFIGVLVQTATSMAARGAAATPNPLGAMTGPIGAIVFVVIGLPFLFIGTAILHLFCLMFRAQGGFIGTLRAVAYSSTASTLIGAIASLLVLAGPAGAMLGGLVNMIGGIWTLVLLVIALREIHFMSTGSAAAAAILPGAICCVLLLVVLVPVFFAARTAAIQGRRGFGAPSSGFPGPSFPPPTFPSR